LSHSCRAIAARIEKDRTKNSPMFVEPSRTPTSPQRIARAPRAID